jgi:hypothetical protein
VVSGPDATREDRWAIARLEARVAALEEALIRRSRELRELQRHLCPGDLARLVRIVHGLPASAATVFDVELWDETTDLTSAEVEDTLRDLWASLAPEQAASDDD